jgi:hypothetical protein
MTKNMEKISDHEFKKKYLYFEKKYIGKNLRNFFGHNIETIFPYINKNDEKTFIKYIKKSKIEYSNRINLCLDKNLFYEYLCTLKDSKILTDIIRLNFTKNFIAMHNSNIKSIVKLNLINTSNLSYIDENELLYFKYDQIKNGQQFIENILSKNIFYKYLLHQDIHNSIINPILISIMLSKYYGCNFKNNSSIIQLRDISQIYMNTNESYNHIEMLYFVKKFFILDSSLSNIPIEYNIVPYFIIKCDMYIKYDHIHVNLTF